MRSRGRGAGPLRPARVRREVYRALTGDTEAQKEQRPAAFATGRWDEALSDDLLSHGLSHTTIGAGAFHFRVRDGIGWYHTAMVAEQPVGAALFERRLAWGLGT